MCTECLVDQDEGFEDKCEKGLPIYLKRQINKARVKCAIEECYKIIEEQKEHGSNTKAEKTARRILIKLEGDKSNDGTGKNDCRCTQ